MNGNFIKLTKILAAVVECALIPPIFLDIFGFKAGGVTVGSLAAVWMSSIGNVVS